MLILGNDILSGKDAFLTDDIRRFHTHIIGGTGKGKSKLLETMMRHDLKNKNGFILIDPHGDLYKSMLDFATLNRYQDRIIIIDPNDTNWSVGLNYLEVIGSMSPAVLAETVMRGMAKIFEDEHQDSMPRLRRWLKIALQTLIYNQATAMEANPLFDVEDTTLRKIFIEKSGDPNLAQEWRHFTQMNKSGQLEIVEPVLNRFSVFTDNPYIRGMIAQDKSTIDFRKAMDEGKAILCNLAATENVSEQSSRLLAVMLIDKIMMAAKSRVNIPVHKRRRFYAYLDEFEDYLCDDIAKGLKGLRKFGISFILAHQEVTPIKEQNIKVYSAVMANTDIKIVFSISREDAEIMANEIFDLSKDEIKDEISQTKFRPRETQREIRSQGHSSGSSSSSGFAHGTIMPGEPGNSLYMTMTDSNMDSSSSISVDSESETTVPFYEYDAFNEVSSRTFRSVEEKKERFINWIQTLPQRRAYFYIKGVLKKPIPIKTLEVQEATVRPKDVEALKERIYNKYALPAAEAKRQIELRKNILLLPPAQSDDYFEQDTYEPPQQ